MTAVDDVAAEVIDRVGPMHAMKLEKLVYYSQAWHLAITGQSLFTDPIEAWRDGPVIDRLFQQHKGRKLVTGWPTGQPRAIGSRGRSVIALVCTMYGNLSGEDLSRLSHSEEPWKVARGNRPSHARSNSHIDPAALARYYRRQKLCGRTAADLAAGGLGLEPESERLSPEELNGELASLRAQFRGQPSHDPSDSSSVSANLSRPVMSDSPRVISVRSRQRP